MGSHYLCIIFMTAANEFPFQDSKVLLYCIVLYCIVLYCIVLYCIVLYCIVLYCIVLYCIVLYCKKNQQLQRIKGEGRNYVELAFL